MTEYVILIGLLALGLLMAVQRYEQQIDVTIRGNMTGAVNKVENGMPAASSDPSSGTPSTGGAPKGSHVPNANDNQ